MSSIGLLVQTLSAMISMVALVENCVKFVWKLCRKKIFELHESLILSFLAEMLRYECSKNFLIIPYTNLCNYSDDFSSDILADGPYNFCFLALCNSME